MLSEAGIINSQVQERRPATILECAMEPLPPRVRRAALNYVQRGARPGWESSAPAGSQAGGTPCKTHGP